jgi:hypothetical protein
MADCRRWPAGLGRRLAPGRRPARAARPHAAARRMLRHRHFAVCRRRRDRTAGLRPSACGKSRLQGRRHPGEQCVDLPFRRQRGKQPAQGRRAIPRRLPRRFAQSLDGLSLVACSLSPAVRHNFVPKKWASARSPQHPVENRSSENNTHRTKIFSIRPLNLCLHIAISTVMLENMS